MRPAGPLPGWVVVVGLCGLLALAVAAAFEPSVRVYDEGFALTNAWRLLHGETPYRDYWTAYPPGTAIVFAAAFAAAGSTLEVARAVGAGWNCLFVLASYALLRSGCGRTAALASTAVLALVFVAAFYPSYSVTPALTLLLLSLALLARGLASRRRAAFAAAGLVAGLALLFRHDFAAYFGLALTAALAAVALLGRWRQDRTLSAGLVTTWLTLVVVATVLLATIVAVCGLQNFVEQSLRFPATGMRANRVLPVPALSSLFAVAKLNWLLAWLVPLGLAATVPALLLSLKTLSTRNLVLLVGLTVLTALLTGQTFSRFDIAHAGPSLIVFGVLLSLLAFGTSRDEVGPIARGTAAAVAGVFLLFVARAAVPTIDPGRHLACLLHPRNGRCMAATDDQRTVAAEVRARTSAGEPVFIGNTRHDRISVNDAFLYFLVQRPIPVIWNEMHPGIVTTEAVQREIVENLQRQRVRIVVLADMPLFDEPNLSSQSSGVVLLDEFLASRYHLVRQVGRYRILEAAP